MTSFILTKQSPGRNNIKMSDSGTKGDISGVIDETLIGNHIDFLARKGEYGMASMIQKLLKEHITLGDQKGLDNVRVFHDFINISIYLSSFN